MLKFIAVTISFLLLSCAGTWKFETYSQVIDKDSIVLEVNNPYSVNIPVLFKCNWNNNLKKFEYVSTQKIRSSAKTAIFLPKNIKHCQLFIN